MPIRFVIRFERKFPIFMSLMMMSIANVDSVCVPDSKFEERMAVAMYFSLIAQFVVYVLCAFEVWPNC